MAHYPSSVVSSAVINTFGKFFHRWDVAEEISLDGGPNLSSKEVKTRLKSWGTSVRGSSAYYPQSNGRAGPGVKSLKRLLKNNTGRKGSIHTYKVAIALLQYRNTPLRGISKSPAELTLGRQSQDTLPLPRERYKIDSQWAHHLREQERLMSESSAEAKVKYDQHSRKLKELNQGDRALCQNVRSRRWDKSGVIIEVGKHRQYHVKMDGSGPIS